MTPEEARALEHGTTHGPWHAICTDDYDDMYEVLGSNPDRPNAYPILVDLIKGDDARLIAAAPDMRATIAAQTWEWGTLVPEHDDAPVWWPTEKEARQAASEDTMIRLVRRLVGPVEVVED